MKQAMIKKNPASSILPFDLIFNCMKRLYLVLYILIFPVCMQAQDITQSVAWDNDTIITMLNLPDIMIKGERPIVKLEEGKLTYDMPRLLEDKIVSNAYESVLQLPGVREQEGNLMLAGASSVTVILNGKPSTMTTEQLYELLKNTPQSRLQNAEVMYSAPPQYHVRGAVINLVLAKGSSEIPNLQGQVNSSYTQKHYGGYSAGTTLLYSSSKLSADLLYSLRQTKERRGLDLFSQHLLNGSEHAIELFNIGYYKRLTHNFRLGLDYQLSEKDRLSIAYTGQISPTQKGVEVSTGSVQAVETSRGLVDPQQMHNMDVHYTSGIGLSTGFDYTFYKSKSVQDFSDRDVRNFLTYSDQEIDRLSVYADQTHTLDTWSLNYGGKFSYASDHSTQFYDPRNGEDMSSLNTDNRQKEYTYDFYASFNKSFSEKLSVSASLTGEYYKYGGFDEWVLFPTFEMSYLFSPSHILQMSFSSDRSYPGYWEMQDMISYLNSYAEIHGNKNLRPSKEYSGQLSYIFNGKYILTAYTSYIDDYFAQLPYQSTERLALIYQTLNWDYKLTAGVNLVVPFKIGERLNSRLTLNGFYDRAKSSEFHDTFFDNKNWVFYSQLENTLKLSSKPNIIFELTGTYITPNIQGPAKISRLWNVDAGLKWTFAKDKGELRLKGSDLFDSWSYTLKTHYNKQHLDMYMLPDSRAVTLSFAYKFGGYKSRERKAVDTSRFGQ